MRIRADFSQRVVLDTNAMDWIPSAMPDVERKMLDRIGGEVARATSLVRFAPGSSFPSHTHGGGEEFYVLEGVFSDLYGDFPAGTYVRNPVGTSHAPRSAEGCIIWVKLHQFDEQDREQKRVDTWAASFRKGSIRGQSILPLHGAVSLTATRLHLAH